MVEKIRYADYIYLTKEQHSKLVAKLGSQQLKQRMKRLMQLKMQGKRPLKMSSDFQALLAMTPRTVEPIRKLATIEKMKQILKEQSYRDYFLFLLGLNTGLRIGDLLPLKVHHVRSKKSLALHKVKLHLSITYF